VANASTVSVVRADALLRHWQDHRRLTRRVVEAFPDHQPIAFSIGGMRSFGTMAMELIRIAAPMVRGIVGMKGSSVQNDAGIVLRAMKAARGRA
jgi:hypothetical protein